MHSKFLQPEKIRHEFYNTYVYLKRTQVKSQFGKKAIDF